SDVCSSDLTKEQLRVAEENSRATAEKLREVQQVPFVCSSPSSAPFNPISDVLVPRFPPLRAPMAWAFLTAMSYEPGHSPLCTSFDIPSDLPQCVRDNIKPLSQVFE